MITFAKEQLIARINQVTAINKYRIGRDPAADGLAMDNELFAIALASLEAEAVAFVMADDLKDSSIISTPAYRDLGEAMERTVGDVVALYTTPPAPVSESEPMKMYGIGSVFKPKILSGVEVDCDNCSHYQPNVCHGEGCPAAMLKGADGSSPVIPDGLRLALSNAGIAAPESDEMLAATCEKYIQELVTWVKDRKPFRSAVIPDGWVMVPEEPTHEMLEAGDEQFGTYDVYRRMITAAPQQEVK